MSENNWWIDVFLKGINVMLNTNRLLQGLNSTHHVIYYNNKWYLTHTSSIKKTFHANLIALFFEIYIRSVGRPKKTRKQFHGLTEMFGCYETIYADAHVRYGETWVSLSLRPEEIRRAQTSGLAPRRGSVQQSA